MDAVQTMTKHQALTHYTEQARIATLEQQRDELAEALREALGWLNTAVSPRTQQLEKAEKMARAALAKLK